MYNSFFIIDIVIFGIIDESVIFIKLVKVLFGYEVVVLICILYDEEICVKFNENKFLRFIGRSDEERNMCSREWEIRCSLVCSVCCL